MLKKSLLIILSFSLVAIAFAAKYKEAPMLAKLVKEGKLPPVDERLPDNPVVVGPGSLISKEWLDWKPGKYGGTLKNVNLQAKHRVCDIGSINLLRSPDQSTKDPYPVMVEKYSYSDDLKVWNFTIRKGIKWSDGVPLTTEDVRFAFEDVYEYENGISHPRALYTQSNSRDGKIAELTIFDKYSFQLKFNKPYGYFIAHMRSWITDHTILFKPKHYLKQFHIKYTPNDKILKKIKEMKMGVDTWQQALSTMDMNHWQSCGRRGGLEIGAPVLQPYMAIEVTPTKVKFSRNPYYYKVDTEGKQLPYVDYLYTVKVNEMETMKLKAASGEINFQAGDIMKLQDAPSWIKGEKTGNYKVTLNGSINNPAMLFMNQDYDYENPNSIWQKLIQDPKKRFANALALAIDHDDVNNSLYFGKYQKPDACDWCKHNNAEYNVDKANKLLDEIGMSERDSDGFRKNPDGSKFTLLILTATDHSPDNAALAVLLGKHFQKIGLNAKVKSMLGKNFLIKVQNNEHQVAVMWNDGPIWGSGISEDYLPAHKAKWAPKSMQHFNTGGEKGRKPPAYLKEFFDLHSARYATLPESLEGRKAFLKLVKWMSENYVLIYPTSMTRSPNIIHNSLRNAPKEGYPYGHGINEAGEQLWFDSDL